MDKNPAYSKFKIGCFTYGDPKIEGYMGFPNINLQIGNFCCIARGVTIWLGANHHGDWVSTSPLNDFLHYLPSDAGHGFGKYSQTSSNGSVIIGSDVWIGANADILSGVTIGDGVIIGTRSVVSKNIPPYCVAVGNPAKVVRKRFSDDQITKLLEIKWWNWDDDRIKNNIPLILSNNIDEFIFKNI